MSPLDRDRILKKLGEILSRTPPGKVEAPSSTGPESPTPNLAALLGGEVVERDGIPYVRVKAQLSEMTADAEGFLANFRYAFEQADFAERPDQFHAEVQKLLEANAAGIVFLDIETTGLSGATVFLIGSLQYRNGDLCLRQLFARDYSEEEGIVREFVDDLRGASALVSFNGKAFDLPFLRDRARFYGIETPIPSVHFDLLHEARRRWKKVMPNCRLQTLERVLCSRWRTNDLPSELIPQVYHDFVRTGNAEEMPRILYHNALDLISMCEILLVILRGGRDWAQA